MTVSDLTVVHLLRHGEVYNPEGILYGRLTGYKLSELGRTMANRIAERFADADLAYVAASPLERAQETAAPIAAQHKLPVDTDERITEAHNIFQGLTFGVGDGALSRPRHWRHLRNPFRPSWGEPYVEQAERMLAAMAEAHDKALGRQALLVSHQLPIWSVRSKVEGRRLWHDPRRRDCSLASLTSFTYDDERIVAVEYTEPAKDLLPDPSVRTKPGA
ncbi:MAG: histidine phosphatase family protein [Candidatus Nanopelagicales bacterium]